MALNATMRALLWSGVPYNVTVQDVARPVITNPTDAIVRITNAAICGTDLHVYHGIYGSAQVPYILGHEGIGVIDSVGPGVEALSVGDHVVVTDLWDLGSLNMAQGEPEFRAGGSPGLGTDYGSYWGAQGRLS